MQDVLDSFDRLLNRFAISDIALDEGESPLASGCASAPARLARCPVVKLSSARTDAPRCRRASTRWEPMNPPPPVTSTLMAII